MTTCNCIHEREGRCTLHPKVWPAGAIMWCHPPADAPCGQQAPREAVPADLDAFKRDRESGPERTGLPWLRWMLGRLWEKGIRALSVGDVQLANEIAQDLPTPPAAAPAPSEAAKAWRSKVGSAVAVEVLRISNIVESSHPEGRTCAEWDQLLDEPLALIAAAEQRASEWAKAAGVNAAEAELMKREREDLRAKLAAAERERDERGNTIVSLKASEAQRTEQRDAALRDCDNWKRNYAVAVEDCKHAQRAVAEEIEKRDAARGRAVEVLRELDKVVVAMLGDVHPLQCSRFCGMIADKIAAEEARGK